MRVTLYTLAGFGTCGREITMDPMTLVDWAQYRQVPSLVYVEKRKRTKMQMRADRTHPNWFIVEGWNGPEAPKAFSEEIGEGDTTIVIRRSIGASFGAEYSDQFNAFADSLKASGLKVIYDGRTDLVQGGAV